MSAVEAMLKIAHACLIVLMSGHECVLYHDTMLMSADG